MQESAKKIFAEARQAITSGNKDKARLLLNRVLESYGDEEDVYNNFWWYRSFVEETPENRLDCIKEVLLAHPTYPAALSRLQEIERDLLQLARQALAAKDYQVARDHVARILEVDDDHEHARSLLAELNEIAAQAAGAAANEKSPPPIFANFDEPAPKPGPAEESRPPARSESALVPVASLQPQESETIVTPVAAEKTEEPHHSPKSAGVFSANEPSKNVEAETETSPFAVEKTEAPPRSPQSLKASPMSVPPPAAEIEPRTASVAVDNVEKSRRSSKSGKASTASTIPPVVESETATAPVATPKLEEPRRSSKNVFIATPISPAPVAAAEAGTGTGVVDESVPLESWAKPFRSEAEARFAFVREVDQLLKLARDLKEVPAAQISKLMQAKKQRENLRSGEGAQAALLPALEAASEIARALLATGQPEGAFRTANVFGEMCKVLLPFAPAPGIKLFRRLLAVACDAIAETFFTLPASLSGSQPTTELESLRQQLAERCTEPASRPFIEARVESKWGETYHTLAEEVVAETLVRYFNRRVQELQPLGIFEFEGFVARNFPVVTGLKLSPEWQQQRQEWETQFQEIMTARNPFGGFPTRFYSEHDDEPFPPPREEQNFSGLLERLAERVNDFKTVLLKEIDTATQELLALVDQARQQALTQTPNAQTGAGIHLRGAGELSPSNSLVPARPKAELAFAQSEVGLFVDHGNLLKTLERQRRDRGQIVPTGPERIAWLTQVLDRLLTLAAQRAGEPGCKVAVANWNLVEEQQLGAIYPSRGFTLSQPENVSRGSYGVEFKIVDEIRRAQMQSLAEGARLNHVIIVAASALDYIHMVRSLIAENVTVQIWAASQAVAQTYAKIVGAENVLRVEELGGTPDSPLQKFISHGLKNRTV